MKQDFHPTYHTNVKVACACGNTFVTGSTTDEIRVEICSNCHPFFTGKAKLLDAAGRVDKFNERLARAKAVKKVTTNVQKPTGDLVIEAPVADASETEDQKEQTNEE